MLLLNYYYIWCSILITFALVFLSLSLFSIINGFSIIMEWGLLSFNSVSFNYIIYLDWVSMSFCFVVSLISSMVILYSSVYMGEYNFSSIRFLMLVLLFVFSMFLMVLSPNMISIMLGWDGLGLVSYCLVIYYSSLKSYLSGMITCLINRLGDIGLLVSIGWMFSFGSWNFMFYSFYYENLLFYLVIFSCFTSSAQIPFSSWLPAAMAAPTPVSSLVHSSTLVTAGVYLLIRFFNYMEFNSNFFLFISLVTMIMSSFCANYEFDLKKIIALSTLSQLGLMMSSLFMGMSELGFFHLLSHAMFKSLLFLCAGIIIHFMGGCQDIRWMGSICTMMPLTCCCFNISNMSLCGFPFLSGFYSKDMIIESGMFNGFSLIFMVLFYFGLGLTSLYSMRLVYYSLIMNCKFLSCFNTCDNLSSMKYSISILSFFSVLFGVMFTWLLSLDLSFIFLPFGLKVIIIFVTLLGLYLGIEQNSFKYIFHKSYYYMNGSMWFMYSYSLYLFNYNYSYSFKLSSMIYWGEFYGGLGMSFYFLKLSNIFQLYFLSGLKVFFVSIIFWLIFLL